MPGDEGTPVGHKRASSKSSVSHSRRQSNADSEAAARPNSGRRASIQEPERPSLSALTPIDGGGLRAGTQEFERLSSSQSTLRPEKPEKGETSSRPSKRSSANARVSPRGDNKKSASYATIVSREKLERANQSVLGWARSVISVVGVSPSHQPPPQISGWDSFKDGVAFLHLIHLCDNSIINLDEFDTSDPIRTLEAAFDIAETFLGVPNVFDPKSFFDSKLLDNGPDARTLFIYLSHFRTVYQERNRADNPTTTAQHLVADLKNLVSRKVSQVEAIADEFENQTLRLVALSTRDELHAEKEYLQQRALTMDKMMEMSIQLNSELESQNLSLREQNRLLNENVTLLKKAVELHKTEKDAALAQLDMVERMKAMAELLQEPDLDKFIELHMEEIEKITAATTTTSTPTISAMTTTADKAVATATATSDKASRKTSSPAVSPP